MGPWAWIVLTTKSEAMFDWLEDSRAMVVAALGLAAVVLLSLVASEAIEAKRAEGRKETIDKFIDLANEGINVWKTTRN